MTPRQTDVGGEGNVPSVPGQSVSPVPPDEEPESWACCGQTFTGTADFISGARAAHVCPPEDVPDAETAYAMGKAAAATPDPPDPRLDAVYAERNAVVLGLAKAGLMLGWRVGKASDPNEPDWPVVYIDTPAGQVSWHFRAADVPDWVEPYPGEWDRHSDREKYERLSRLPTAPAASPDERLREAAGLLSRAKTALRAHRLNWLALSDRLDAPYPDRPDSSPWSRFALPVCQRGKAVEDEIVAALAAADREKPEG